MGEVDRQTWRRIGRLLAGELTGEEARELRTDLEDDPETRAALHDAEGIWEAVDGTDRASRWDSSGAWDELRACLDEPGSGSAGAPGGAGAASRPARSSGLRWAGRVAALLLIGLAGFWVAETRPFSGDGGGDRRAFSTQEAEQLDLRLADGSTVQLAPDSRLVVDAGYGREARTVRLEGLAYFRVEPSRGRPFRVRTDRSVVRAVGTRFVIRSYAAEAEESVVVEEGRVRLRGRRRPSRAGTELHAGQRGSVSPDGTVAVRRADVDGALSWREGRLSFDDAPLRQVLRTLERWYAVEFELNRPALGDRRFTGSFGRESAAEVARILATTLGLDHRLRDSTVVLGAGR